MRLHEQQQQRRVIAGGIAADSGDMVGHPLSEIEGGTYVKGTTGSKTQDLKGRRAFCEGWGELACLLHEVHCSQDGNFLAFYILGPHSAQPQERVSYYLLPLAVGNALGPILIGCLFDVIGRKPMIVITYAASGVLLALSGWLVQMRMLTAQTQAIL